MYKISFQIMLWKTNFDKDWSESSAESSPKVVQVNSISDENEDNDQEGWQKTKDEDDSVLLDPRKSDNYNLSDCIEV